MRAHLKSSPRSSKSSKIVQGIKAISKWTGIGLLQRVWERIFQMICTWEPGVARARLKNHDTGSKHRFCGLAWIGLSPVLVTSNSSKERPAFSSTLPWQSLSWELSNSVHLSWGVVTSSTPCIYYQVELELGERYSLIASGSCFMLLFQGTVQCLIVAQLSIFQDCLVSHPRKAFHTPLNYALQFPHWPLLQVLYQAPAKPQYIVT